MKALKIIAVLLVATFLYYKFAYPTYTYRYRMTAEVETPEGLKTGSSVVEITTKQWPEWLRGLAGGHTSNTRSKGEAVFIEMPNEKILFIVSKGEEREYWLPYTFPMQDVSSMSAEKIKSQAFYLSKTREGIRYYGTLKNAKGVLPEYSTPLFLYFRDINNPMTVEQIDPKNLEKVFGKGVKLKGITIETTNDPLEWKIESYLKWLPEYDNKLFDGRRIHTADAENKLANSLGSGSFSNGKEK